MDLVAIRPNAVGARTQNETGPDRAPVGTNAVTLMPQPASHRLGQSAFAANLRIAFK
jgi:hypothetical protein